MNLDINKITEILRTFEEIDFAYLFGSYANGTETPLSDVDIAVYLNNNCNFKDNNKYPYGYESFLIGRLSIVLKTDKIDLVLLNKADLLICEKIYNTGMLLFEKDRLKRIKIENSVRKEFIDTEHYRKIKSKYLQSYFNVR